MADRLYRSKDNRILGGVCGGIAEHLDIDPSLIRIITVLLIFSGISPIFYLIMWLIIPSEEEVTGTRSRDTQRGDEEGSRNDLNYESPDRDEDREESEDED